MSLAFCRRVVAVVSSSLLLAFLSRLRSRFQSIKCTLLNTPLISHSLDAAIMPRYDWSKHKERLIRDYWTKNLQWTKILVRNNAHGLRARFVYMLEGKQTKSHEANSQQQIHSKRACQARLKEWGYTRDLHGCENQKAAPEVAAEPTNEMASRCLSPGELVEGSLSEEQRQKFQVFLAEERQKILILPKLRECCQKKIWPPQVPSLPCLRCGLAGVHRLSIMAPHLPEEELRRWVAIFKTKLNEEDLFGNTPLHFLAASGEANVEHFILFIQEGADVRRQNTRGETFLHILKPNKLQYRLPGLLSHLLEDSRLQFLFERRDVFGCTALHRIFEHNFSPRMSLNLYQTLQSHNINLNHRDCFGKPENIVQDDMVRSKTLLEEELYTQGMMPEHNMDFHLSFSDVPSRHPKVLALRNTLCQGAACQLDGFDFRGNPGGMNERLKRMRGIIEKSYHDPKIEDESGNNALHCLFWLFYFDQIKMDYNFYHLLYMVDINHYNKEGETPLHTLIWLPPRMDYEGCVEMYLEAALDKRSADGDRCFNIEQRDSTGQTILFTACTQGRVEIVRALLRLKANPYVRNWDGDTIREACKKALEWCIEDSQSPCQPYLRQFRSKQVENLKECMALIGDTVNEDPDVFLQWRRRISTGYSAPIAQLGRSS
jgi:Ankyrin repeat